MSPGGPRFEVAVIHYTDCTHFLADADFRRGFADLIGSDGAVLAAQAVVHREQTVRADVQLLRSSAILPATITVSGHVYDVNTGLIATIIPAAPMHTSSSWRATRQQIRRRPPRRLRSLPPGPRSIR